MKLQQLLLTMLIAAHFVRSAQAWQFQPGPRPDPYAQPPVPGGNTGFRFAPDPNLQQPAQPAAPQAQPAMQPPVGFQPNPQFAPQQFNPPLPQAVPPQTAPPQAAAPPAGVKRPDAVSLVIPGYDPLASSPNAKLPEGAALYQPSQIVATVGNQYILYGDVEPTVNQMLAPVLAKIRTDAERQELESVRPRLTQQVVRQMVETKILYLDFEREIEAKAKDKMNEIRQEIAKKMRDNFEKQLLSTREKVLTSTPEEIQDMAKRDPILPRLAILMKEHQIETLADLDQVLRRYGSSLEKQQRQFADFNLGRSNLSEKLKVKTEVSHLEMLNYYRDHADDFAVKARAKFEIISVRYDSFPNKQAAYAAIAQMGNEIYYGTPFAAVARKGSQEPNASKGGAYDWTTEKSLASEVVDRAIFSLEMNALSEILADEKSFHIVRVTDRQQAGFIPFTDAQVKIKELINQQRREVAYKECIETLRKKTVVWTIYDGEAAGTLATQPGAPGATQR
ncbi:peptidylprolyl isomerase [Anatilimnocola aggregata]|uniref:Peptidylprolyl isomerase n=1 Tax=Anatilimnocola aggregata TaxID=2528021 RepID=A0A517YD53_9BACT|nr:peptidylprolyl isomerase [Anatilimnocola aggregata]QDU28166.1 peptidylprolyl isomerase [Anatilimnocola aggregata]